MRGYEDYFANLLVDEGRVTHEEFPLIVYEFIDVFPKDFSGMSPISEIDFTTDLDLSIPAIFIQLYHMAVAVLTKLKTYLEELPDRGLIFPSALPWGAPVLLAKKKDGSLRLCIDYHNVNFDS